MTSGDSEAVDASASNARVAWWGAFASGDFRFFWAHGFFQGTARSMREMLIPLLVWQLSGSAVNLGITGLFQAIPAIIFGLIGGALADSLDRKKLLIYTQSANLIASILLAVMVVTEVADVWHLWVFSSFWSGVYILGRPSQRAYLPSMVPGRHLMNALAWFGALSQGTLFIGPILAGIIAQFVDIGWAFMINAAILSLGVLFVLPIKASGKPEGDRKASWRTVVEGIQFVRLKEVLLSAMVLDFAVMSVGFFRPLLPILADLYDVGEVGLGLMNGATAVGSVVGTFVLVMLGNVDRKGLFILFGYFGYAIGLLVLGLSPWFYLALGALVLMGTMDVVAFTLKQSMIQLVAPDQFRGRAASLSSILSVVGNATGSVENGFLAAIVGAPGAIVINSVIAFGMTGIVGVRWRALAGYHDPED